MTATILDGKALSATLRGEIDAAVAEFTSQHGYAPAIAVMRAGEDPASVSYAGQILKTFEKRGMTASLHTLPETATQAEIVALVQQLNADPAIHGIMVQEPLPKGIDEAAVKAVLSPDKDVDGVHPVNTGRLAQAAPVGRPAGVAPFFVPATPAGGLEMLKRNDVAISGKMAVVVGRSTIVGKPMALLLMRENATVIVAHSRTPDLAGVCRQADILCAAVGRANIITADMVKPGAAVIDFGVNFVDGSMCGDVDYEAVKEVAGLITPVPGGTGPMTNVMLAINVLEAARLQAR
ncbi:MAG: bifunctional 5,10-methylenetetrahydrofolate dehydrogenase/5,10-methenyltetrahydrofolate cyclohydrolase [Chloroflexi bacterium]|nr:bifunctional 5,10-methylenetetrahydrofolate dehydrogenase/5,10-methenyltetrahydrofolate cyclohydrolase [Chloroflexota bacterium]MBU1749389.1 bifunctional 5,10-methylenetetrahydrofolate dehydrogenase/5,10-methenyltetrahydrofolate cyclohydrolase [Chloroflexota bacterium]